MKLEITGDVKLGGEASVGRGIGESSVAALVTQLMVFGVVEVETWRQTIVFRKCGG